MSIQRSSLIAVLMAALAAPSLAQAQDAAPLAGADTDPVTPTQSDVAPAAEEPDAEEADAATGSGEPVETTPATGDPAQPEVLEVVKDTFGDWEVRCAPNGEDCFMYQLALDPQNNPVAEVSMIKLPEGADAAAGVTMVTPLGTLLPMGVVIQIDEGEMRQYPFNWCSQVGCFARFGLTDQSITGMKRGSVAKISLASFVAPDQPVTLNLSLTGFTDGYNSLTPTEMGSGVAPVPGPSE